MRSFRVAFLLVVAAGALTHRAAADLVTYTATGTSSDLQLFDPAKLGVLQGVTFNVALVKHESLTAANATASPLAFFQVTTHAVSVDAPSLAANVASGQLEESVAGVVAGDATQTFAGSTTDFHLTSQAYGPDARFEGGGTFAYTTDLPMTGQVRNFPSGLTVTGDVETYDETVSVTYRYTPTAAVPEPPAAAMVALAAGLWGAWRWRRGR